MLKKFFKLLSISKFFKDLLSTFGIKIARKLREKKFFKLKMGTLYKKDQLPKCILIL